LGRQKEKEERDGVLRMLSEVARFRRMVLGNFASRGNKESRRNCEASELYVYGEAWGLQDTCATVMMIIYSDIDFGLSTCVER
jgi:hypothetical protein